MPYRAELKRPDLKGSFPCSICGKIFCHSSSLSRHRMQAHFKSYTCTQCNNEIPSNDTLRSHMYRMHNITRMFMCRCCNWAFPDKTSLHIHMQSMQKSGTPGDAAVLAKSSDDGSSESTSSPSRSPSFLAESFLHKHMMQMSTNNNAGAIHNNNNNNISSIFPNLLKTTEGVVKPIFPLDLSSMGQNHFLSAWLANNSNGFNLSNGNSQLNQKQVKSEDISSDYDDLEVHTTEDDIKNEFESGEVSPRSVIMKAEPSEDRKRKNSFEENEDIDVEGDEGEPPLKMSMDEKDLHISHDQPSPTVSDSHISGSSSQSGEISKCFDCQVAKGKLSASEEKCRVYEKQIRDLQTQIEMFRKLPISPPRAIPQVMIPPPMMSIPNVAPPANLLQNPAMRFLLNNLVQNQINRKMC